VATTAVVPRPHLRELRGGFDGEFRTELGRRFRRRIPRELPQPFHGAAAVARSRRLGFYLDVLGAAVVMAMFVAAAIFV